MKKIETIVAGLNEAKLALMASELVDEAGFVQDAIDFFMEDNLQILKRAIEENQ